MVSVKLVHRSIGHQRRLAGRLSARPPPISPRPPRAVPRQGLLGDHRRRLSGGLIDARCQAAPGGRRKMHVDRRAAFPPGPATGWSAGNRAAWVELQPLTGRTHPSCPYGGDRSSVVGDAKYGGARVLTGGISRSFTFTRRLKIDGLDGKPIDYQAGCRILRNPDDLGFDPMAGDRLPLDNRTRRSRPRQQGWRPRQSPRKARKASGARGNQPAKPARLPRRKN